MRRKFIWKLSIGLVLFINCIVAYAIFFLWNVGYYRFIAIALLLSFAIGVAGLENHEGFLNKIFVPLALFINYTCGITVSLIWKTPDFYLYSFLSITSFLAGILINNLRKAIISTSISVVASTATAVGIIIAPAIAYGETAETIDIALSSALYHVSKTMLIGGVLCLASILLASFASDFLD